MNPGASLADTLEKSGFFRNIPDNDDKRLRKHLSFDDWWSLELERMPWLRGKDKAEAFRVWKAAQENK